MAVEMKGAVRPALYRFRLGDFEITTLLDGVSRREGPHPFFGADQPAEAVHALARANHLPTHAFEHGFTVTLVNTGREFVLFDTGNGARGRSAGSGFLTARLEEAGHRPEDIDIVVLTHCHPDHIGGLVAGDRPTFANARYVFGAVEFDAWRRGENLPDRRKATRELFMAAALPLADKASFIRPGETVVAGIEALEAFGHSPGHMAYHLESAGQRLLVWGDLTNHYVVSLQRPEWHVGVDDDREKAVASRKRVLDMVASDRLFAIGYHMPFPAIGAVDRGAEGYRWVPLTYQFAV